MVVERDFTLAGSVAEISLWLVSAVKQPQVPGKEPQRTAVARREVRSLEG